MKFETQSQDSAGLIRIMGNYTCDESRFHKLMLGVEMVF